MELIKQIEYKENPEGIKMKVISHEFAKSLCFVCGSKKKKLTRHHVLPERLKPLRNIIVPLCQGCHRNIHELTGKVKGRITKKNQVLMETSVKGIYYKKEVDAIESENALGEKDGN